MNQPHEYVTHHTYTGPGCAICGQSEAYHRPRSDDGGCTAIRQFKAAESPLIWEKKLERID